MTEGHILSHLPLGAARLAAIFARPKTIAMVCIAGLTALGWSALALMTADASAFNALCRAIATPQSVAGFALLASMWGAMTLAMMLPSAAPMILTYSEIADTAAHKGEHVVSPFVIAAGFAAVWFGFAIAAAAAQLTLTHAALLNDSMAVASGLFSGAIFVAAGAYQFSALKQACLRQCQQPFSFFFTNWKTTPRGVFGLGVKQGLYCLGCCWAMMMVMFAVGVMNIIWMAALGVVMTIEKIGAGKRFTYGVGAVLIALGAGVVVWSAAGHWPAHAV